MHWNVRALANITRAGHHKETEKRTEMCISITRKICNMKENGAWVLQAACDHVVNDRVKLLEAECILSYLFSNLCGLFYSNG
jgi:hypothetical protein